MSIITQNIQNQTDAYNALADAVADIDNPVDSHKKNYSAVRAWRFNIRQNISRIEKSKLTEEDQLNELNARITAINDESEGIEVPVKLYSKSQVEQYLGQLQEHKKNVTRTISTVERATAKNRTVVLSELRNRERVINSNIEATQAWLSNAKADGESAETSNAEILEKLNAEIAKLNSEV